MINDLPILGVLKTKMRWHEARQRILSENVANADTAGYRGKDLVTPRFETPAAPGSTAAVRLAATEPGHLGGPTLPGRAFRVESRAGLEITPNGNQVTLEEEMTKVAENQLDYQAAASLYQRGLAVIRTAIGKRA